MYTQKKKNPRGLKIFLVITYLIFVLFAAALIVFGLFASKTSDADFSGGIGDVFKYHFSGLPDLFTFSFNNASNIIYVALSGLLYLFIVISVIYIIVGIIVSAKRKRAIIIPSLIASVLVVLVFMMVATGLPKYWAIINKRDAFVDDNTLILLTVTLLISSVIFILFAYISYFASLANIFKGSAAAVEEKKEVTITDENDQSQEEKVVFEPVSEEAIPEESIPVPELEPEPEPEPEQAQKENAPRPNDKDDLRDLLKEVVRDIVRDEIARNNANQPNNNNVPASTVTGATFGGPLVVQYFNGGINSAPAPTPVQEEKPAPAPQPQKEEVKEEVIPAQEPEPVAEEEKAEEPVSEPEPVVEEEKAEEPAPEPESVPEVEEPAPVEEAVEEEPAPEPVPEPAPEEKEEETVEPAPIVEEPAPEVEQPIEPEAPVEKKPIIRIPFTERMINADAEMQNNYNELKNEILSYGVNSRVSNSGDTFRLHRKTYIKITIAGLSLKLYFALNPDDYKDSTLPIQNAGHKGIYEEIPLVFKVKSGLSMRRCKQLIADVFEKNGLEQGEIGNVDWVEQLKNAPQEDNKDED